MRVTSSPSSAARFAPSMPPMTLLPQNPETEMLLKMTGPEGISMTGEFIAPKTTSRAVLGEQRHDVAARRPHRPSRRRR